MRQKWMGRGWQRVRRSLDLDIKVGSACFLRTGDNGEVGVAPSGKGHFISRVSAMRTLLADTPPGGTGCHSEELPRKHSAVPQILLTTHYSKQVRREAFALFTQAE